MNMIFNFPNRRIEQRNAGFTLTEVTLVVAILLGLISALFVGTASYKEGSNRAICVQQTATVQTAVRSYCNLHQIEPGQPVSGLKLRLIQPDGYVPICPVCPSGGAYAFIEEVVPALGTRFMTCTILEHAPSNTSGW